VKLYIERTEFSESRIGIDRRGLRLGVCWFSSQRERVGFTRGRRGRMDQPDSVKPKGWDSNASVRLRWSLKPPILFDSQEIWTKSIQNHYQH